MAWAGLWRVSRTIRGSRKKAEKKKSRKKKALPSGPARQQKSEEH